MVHQRIEHSNKFNLNGQTYAWYTISRVSELTLQCVGVLPPVVGTNEEDLRPAERLAHVRILRDKHSGAPYTMTEDGRGAETHCSACVV